MKAIFWSLVGGLLIYEAVAIWESRPADTISGIIMTVSAKRPIIPFLIGLLCGHWFFGNQPVKP